MDIVKDASFLEDEANDAQLLALATERISHFDPSTTVSQEQVDREFGFTATDYEKTDGIEFE